MPHSNNERILASLDIGATYIKYGVVLYNNDTRSTAIVWNSAVNTKADSGVDELLATISTVVNDLLIRTPNVQSIGVGVPGIVDPLTRYVQNPPNIAGWGTIDLRNHICQSPLTASIPVYVENDANCGAIAELRAGAGKNQQDFIYVTLGTGVGSGIVLNGSLYVGAHGEAGEVGHMLSGLHPGRKLEDIVGNKGIVERYGTSVTVQEIDNRAQHGEEHAIDVLTETGMLIGESLCSALAVLGMRTVIVGGGVSRSSFVVEGIRRQLNLIPIPTIRASVQLLQAQFLDHAGLVGAALLGVA